MGTLLFDLLAFVLACLVLGSKMYCVDEGEAGILLGIFFVELLGWTWLFYELFMYAASHL